jgi:hypothetical protein
MNKYIQGLSLLLVLLIAGACSTDFEIYAPTKEIRVAYCVLNPDANVQYLRIARAYQSDGDALVYAAENDLSLKGLTVTLKGDGKTWMASEVDTIAKDSGLFARSQTIYGFVTDGSGVGKAKLLPGKTYQLEIGSPEDSSYITAHTTIPAYPVLTGKLAITFGSGTYKCLPRVGFDSGFPVSIKRSNGALGYEIRVIFSFEENGNPRQLVWDANSLIRDNKGCNDGSGNICYQIGDNAVIRAFGQEMPPGPNYTYYRKDSCVLNPGLSYLYPRSLIFEATAVDTFLSNYIYVNSPANGTDLNTSRPEYTNFTGNVQAAGVFGSYSLDSALTIMNPCSEWLLGLNGTPKPLSFCE